MARTLERISHFSFWPKDPMVTGRCAAPKRKSINALTGIFLFWHITARD
jgi:hypothetical protein